jgi:hypothetical protein
MMAMTTSSSISVNARADPSGVPAVAAWKRRGICVQIIMDAPESPAKDLKGPPQDLRGIFSFTLSKEESLFDPMKTFALGK